MTTVTGNSYLDALASKAGTSATAKKSNQSIDQSGFLKLLTKQLTTQDPTAPTDNAQMVAQMAQMSATTGIAEMNQSIKSMASDLAAARFGDASSWIGRAALVNSDNAAALSNGAYAGSIDLPDNAGALNLSLVDSNGSTVFAHDFGAKSKGAVDWSWDGKDASGKAVAGPLRMVVGAYGTTGTPLAVTNSSWAEVQSVQSPASGTTKLITALGDFAPSDVQQLG